MDFYRGSITSTILSTRVIVVIQALSKRRKIKIFFIASIPRYNIRGSQ